MKTEIKYLTTEELALRWRMSPGSLANWRSQNKGPSYVKVGLKALYALTEITDWEKRSLKKDKKR